MSITRFIILHRKFSKCTLHKIAVPMIVAASHYSGNPLAHELSDGVALSYSIVNYAGYFIDNYLHRIDQWREQEARYEDKLDPPPPGIYWSKNDNNVHTNKVLSIVHEIIPGKEATIAFILVQVIVNIIVNRTELIENIITFFIDLI